MYKVSYHYLNSFANVLIDDIWVYSKHVDDHVQHLRIVLQEFKNEQLYAKFLKFEFWHIFVSFLGHIVSKEGIMINLAKVEAV